MTSRSLGRLHIPDPRDSAYPVRTLLPARSGRVYRYWENDGWWGDQGWTSQCVAYAWTHWLEDGPVPQDGPAPCVDPAAIYREAQKIDEWPGEDYEGTSVRAGAKVLQALGYIREYRWAYTLEDVVAVLLELGPVVVGTAWYDSMFDPHPDETLRIRGKRPVGGHAYLLNGVNTKTERVRLKNSWGRSWGVDGHAYLRFGDLARLLREDGEACLAVEVERPAAAGVAA